MTIRWNEEIYTIVYNGELYNTAELKDMLLRKGHTFCGHSDTEVVLHSYAEWGSAALSYFNGIFAFAVYEEKANRIFLARDRIGVKPLFYYKTVGALLFSSEIKTLFCCPQVHAELDLEGVYQIVLLGPGRVPGSGVFHEIKEMEPGWYGYFENGLLKLHQYWRLLDRVHTDTFEETAEKVRCLVCDSIKRQTVSDVPFGTFLSGGLDSSIITALCAEDMNKKGKMLKTFSVDYLHNDQFFISGKFQPDEDGIYIERMLDAFSTDHSYTVLTSEDLVNSLEPATIARDLPGMADVDFSLLAFSKEIRKDVKMALSGECADEIFGGYPWYRDKAIREKNGFPWSQTIRERHMLLNSHILSYQDAESYVMDQYLDTCNHSDIFPDNDPENRRIKEMVNLNFRWFMQTLLDRKDRMTMFYGLEVRVPFCDYRLAEYMYGVPWVYKEYMGREKGLLRYAVRDLLPPEILQRKKSPYPKTFDPEYENLVTEKMNHLISSGDSPLFYFLDKKKISEYMEKEAEWPWYGQLMRRPQTIAYLLQIDFWLRHYHIQFRF